MSLSRIGGALVAAAAALLAVTLVVGLNGGSISVRGDGLGSLTLTVALVLLGAGLLVLAIVGPPPFGGRLVRTGFLIVAVGGAAELASASATADSALVYVLLLGGLAVVVGVVISGIGLLRTPGRPRWVGLMFVAGVALALVAGAVANDPGVAFSTDAGGTPGGDEHRGRGRRRFDARGPRRHRPARVHWRARARRRPGAALGRMT